MASLSLVAVSLLILPGCWWKKSADEPAQAKPAPVSPAAFRPGPAPVARETGPLYFASPKEAVALANDLLRAKDWATLTRYYDLSLTPHTERAELESGRFFVDETTSPTGPGAVTRYKRPFPPGSAFIDAAPVGDAGSLPCIWSMHTVLEIDQGGGMKQRAVGGVSLIQMKEGFRFLPPARVADAMPIEPAAAAAPAPDTTWHAKGSDDVLFYRPALQARAAEVPAAGMRNVPALAAYLEKQKSLAAAHPGVTRRGGQPWEPEYVYEPSDEELMLSLVGDRLFRTLSIAPLGALADARKGWPTGVPEALEYRSVPIQRVEVAGTGPRYIAGTPVARRLKLTEG